MSSYVAGSLIGAGAVLAGVVVTAVRDTRARKAERQAEYIARVESALREYLAVLDAIALELPGSPRRREPARVDRWLAKLLEDWLGLDVLAFVLARVMNRVAYGRRADELLDRLTSAATHLRLIAPPSILEIMRENDQAAEVLNTDPQRWAEEWLVRRDGIRERCRTALGAIER